MKDGRGPQTKNAGDLWKLDETRKQNPRPQGLQKETQPCPHLDFSPVSSALTSQAVK